MTAKFKTIALTAMLASASAAWAGTPVTHVMPCCRSMNNGTKFLVNGQWNPDHDYNDIEQCRDILQKIKDAGINVVSIDFTNPSQWDLPYYDNGKKGENFDDMFLPMLDNIVKVCAEKDMKFFIFLGNTRAWTMKYWNDVAKKVWDNYAQLPHYQHYGYGDDRPMLLIFLPGRTFEEQCAETPDNEKDYLAKFRIGTTEVNERILPTKTDGWGYRNFSQSSDGKVRFCAPNGGVHPSTWCRIDAAEWADRVDWALGADEYTVFGSYDDVCDGIFWGIADCLGSQSDYHRNYETLGDPFVYYNIVKEGIANDKKK